MIRVVYSLISFTFNWFIELSSKVYFMERSFDQRAKDVTAGALIRGPGDQVATLASDNITDI